MGDQTQPCLYALYVLSQRSEEERPGQTSRGQEMERLQKKRKMYRMAAAAAAAAAAMRCRTACCSGAAGTRRNRRQSTLRSSHRLRGSVRLVDKSRQSSKPRLPGQRTFCSPGPDSARCGGGGGRPLLQLAPEAWRGCCRCG